MSVEPNTEKRLGATSTWTLIERNPDLVIAVSEWGSLYAFRHAQWNDLPVISEPLTPNAPTSRPQ